MNLLSCFALASILLSVSSTSIEEIKDRCEAATTCKECLDTNGDCQWCAQDDYTKIDPSRPRCTLRKNLEDNKCSDIQIVDGTLQASSDEFDGSVQVIPKKVSVKLRPGQSKSFTLSVKPAENYPVRLYYLMDMSKSMEDDLVNLRSLGSKIAAEIKNITNNFQLAFGTFVDKTVSPFVQPAMIDKPCSNCEATFGYHHIFNFHQDATLFEAAVGRQKISGNLDTPEGGFDALLQVAVCGDQIWPKNEHSRRIVVFVTDASPHIAGDGRVGGITEPNDGKCHLTSKDGKLTYSKTNKMDYPSISQLYEKMKDNKIVPIIAVTKDVEPIFKKLVEEWKDLGTGLGSLERDSSNIVELIKENYEKISRTVLLTDNSPSNVVVKYKLTQGCVRKRSESECVDVDVNQKVDFRVVVTSTHCPDKWKNGDKFKITVPGFGDVEVDVEYICECECDASAVPNSPVCQGNGTYQCGICDCNDGRFGMACECTSESKADTSLCILPNSTDTKVCSGRGSCVCGKCECNLVTNPEYPDHKVSGKYCQCDNYNCDRHDGKICGGRGICKCGKCICQEAFMGDNCGQRNCTMGQKECTRDGVVCSGHGTCDCNQCLCDTGYNGQFCEKCVTCPGKCQSTEDCVLCHPKYKTRATREEKSDDEICAKCKLNIILLNGTYADDYGKFVCSAYYNETCRVYYSFQQDLAATKEIVFLEEEPRCMIIQSTEVNVLLICMLIVGGIVLVALLLLLAWKIITTFYDKMEYQKFLEETRNKKWANDQNPIYRSSTQQYKNPNYTGK